MHVSVSSCIFNHHQDQRVYELKRQWSGLHLNSRSQRRKSLYWYLCSLTVLVDLFHAWLHPEVQFLGWLRMQWLVFDIFWYIRHAINKWCMYAFMDEKPLQSLSCWRGGGEISIWLYFCNTCRPDPTGSSTSRCMCTTEGTQMQALVGFQESSWLFSIQQTFESVSHVSLMQYQGLSNSMLPISPVIYYVKQTKLRTANCESGVRRRHEWKQILFKRLLDVARFINLFPKFSCQNNVWQKRIVL